MNYPVFLTDDAARDLDDLYDHIQFNDSPKKADYVLKKIEQAFSSLSDNPQRRAYPNELLVIGLREYREIDPKPHSFDTDLALLLSQLRQLDLDFLADDLQLH